MQGSHSIEKADLKAAERYARSLAEKIRKYGFFPTLVVGVETGGHLVGKILADLLGARFETVRIRRKTSKYTHSDVARRLVQKQRLKIRGKILDFVFPFLNPRKEASTVGKLDGAEKILVVDDGTRSGKTMRMAKEELIKKGATPENIKTAAVNVLGKTGRPDFFLTTKNISWPWSIRSPEYRAFRKWQRRERKQRQQETKARRLR